MEIYKVYGKDPTWTQKGIYMTRLAAAANEKELCIGMDTQVSDSICGDKQSEMIKILHNSNYCVCVLGTLELFTSIGTFKFLDIVKNVLTQTYTDIFSLIKDLQIAVGMSIEWDSLNIQRNLSCFGQKIVNFIAILLKCVMNQAMIMQIQYVDL